MGQAGAVLSLDSGSQQPQEEGEAVGLPTIQQILSEHLLCTRSWGEGEGCVWKKKQIKYTSLPWEVYKRNPSSVRGGGGVNTLLSLGLACRNDTCSFYHNWGLPRPEAAPFIPPDLGCLFCCDSGWKKRWTERAPYCSGLELQMPELWWPITDEP